MNHFTGLTTGENKIKQLGNLPVQQVSISNLWNL